MKHMLSLLLALCLAFSFTAAAAADAAAVTSDEIAAFAATLLETARQSELQNDPAGEEALSEDGYAMVYPFGTLYADRTEMTEETRLAAAMITDPEIAGPRGIRINAHYPDLLTVFRNDNPTLDGSRDGALLYLEGDETSGFTYGQVLRNGQRIHSVEYGAVLPAENGFSRASLTFSVEMDLVSTIRVEGLTETTDAEAAAALLADLQTLQQEKGYTQFIPSWTGTDLTPFGPEDLTFSGIHFLSLQPGDFGPLAEDVLVSNDEDGWLRVVNNADFSATLVCNEDGSNAKISYLELVSDAVEGPRGVRLGDSISMDLNRFRSGDGEISDDALYEMLYGTEGAAPWGKAFYLDGDGMTLRYVTEAEGSEVELYLHYSGNELSEIRLSAKP